MAGMIGTYNHTIDAKGRLFIPAKLREELGNSFYVTLSSEPCLTIYSNERWAEFEEKVSAMPRTQQRKIKPIFAHAAYCEVDSQGRILLPQPLRAFAGLEKNVIVVGFNEFAEIWDEDKWNEDDAIQTTPENIAEAFEELGL